MPKKMPTPAPKEPVNLAMSPDEARSRIGERIANGQALKASLTEAQTRNLSHTAALEFFDFHEKEYSKWDSFNIELLRRIFTTDELADEYSRWVGGGGLYIGRGGPSVYEKIKTLADGIGEKMHRLDSIRERLGLIPVAQSQMSQPPPVAATTSSVINANKVFVVHGHDDRSKANLEVFLHENGLEPVVLHRQADEGQTVIEKFEKHSDVGYAFILLTPDEIAYLRADDEKPDAMRRKEARARPNVIFEFGYFVGRLGRKRVCCLLTGDVAVPSDLNGLIYKRYSASVEEAGYSILKDLRAAGYKV